AHRDTTSQTGGASGFQGQGGSAAIGQGNGGEGTHGRLQGKGAFHGAGGRGPVGVVEPASNGISCKADHAPAILFDFGNQRGIYRAQVFGQFLRALPRSQRFTQGFGQGREAG